MAEPEVIIDEAVADETMAEAEETVLEGGAGDEPTGLEDVEPNVPERAGFLECFRSPIIELVVGRGDEETALYAHQALLVQSPFFQEAVAQMTAAAPRRMLLPHDDLSATSSVLEYLYKSDYFPTLDGPQALEYDPTVPQPDEHGVGLLRHARVYTLAQRFGLPNSRSWPTRRSTSRSPRPRARSPVAQFWATRSHVLRHEAEAEFKRMCLEFPQFGFDVLSLVLDAQEKRTARSEAQSTGTASGRKRQRVSGL
ncbi:hypothetical protein Tdes44962_MAKER10405 [Teratosphaeria destructans]|uniref:BTB domain-containing protein n=1 Tax=Teratosphaeria destructans TaxID=418781 RepID=A0A9W7SIQ7_9PEZI|nr:hypothetical protein Tdes44962_MAKER10405 [Teratosphaeria destructans]